MFVGSGAATITRSTFARNRVGDGGRGASTAPGGTLWWVGGDGGSGGGPAVGSGTVTVRNATIQGNRSGRAGLASVSGGQVAASILADGGVACDRLSVAGLPNAVLPGTTGCPGPAITGDAALGALAANGGPTPTLAPGSGSVAVDAIVGVPCPATDQRGLPRPQLGGCDIGAVEVQPGAPGAPGAGGPGGGAAVTARTLTKLTLTSAAFRTSGRRASTTVRFTLGQASRVVLSVRRSAPGRTAARGRCVAPTRRLAGARRCVRQETLPGRARKAGVAGANTLRFTGRVAGRTLAPGRSTMVVTLRAAGGAPPVVRTRVFRNLA